MGLESDILHVLLPSNALVDTEAQQELRKIAAAQSREFPDFIERYRRGETWKGSILPPKPDRFDMNHDVLLAPIPPKEIENERLRHTFYTRLTNHDGKSPLLQEALGRIRDMAKRTFQVPSVSISIMTEHQWINQCSTLDLAQFAVANREMTLCGHTILQNGTLAIPDLAQDWRFKNQIVVQSGIARFYAGCPLWIQADESELIKLSTSDTKSLTTNRFAIGTICVLDKEVRTTPWTDEDSRVLEHFATSVVDSIQKHLYKSQTEEQETRARILAEFCDLPIQEGSAGGFLATTSGADGFQDDSLLFREASSRLKLCFGNKVDVRWQLSANTTHSRSESAAPGDDHVDLEYLAVDVYDRQITPHEAQLEKPRQSYGVLELSAKREDRVFTELDSHFLRTFANSMTTFIQSKHIVRAHRVHSEFLGNISHEICTPAHALTASIDLLLDESHDLTAANQRNMMEMVQGLALNMSNVVMNLVSFNEINKHENTDERVAPENVNVDQLIQELLDGFVLQLHPRTTLNFTNSINDLSGVRSDAMFLRVTPLRKALAQIIMNACKFTNGGSVTVELNHCERINKLIISVIDTGCGIGKEFQRGGLFQPGRQEDAFTPGLGLGLHIAKQATAAIDPDATLSLVHSSNEGSIFSLEIPTPVQTRAGSQEEETTNSLGYISNQDLLVQLLSTFDVALLGQDREALHGLDYFLQSQSKIPWSTDQFQLQLNCLTYSDDPHIDQTIRRISAEFDRLHPDTRVIQMVVLICESYRFMDLVLNYEDCNALHLLTSPIGRTKGAQQLLKILERAANKRDRLLEHRVILKRKAEEQLTKENIDSVDVSKILCLVADDNIINVRLLTTWLRRKKIRCISANDGSVAVEEVKKHQGAINLILMDLQMPILDGIRAVEQIRKLEREQHPDWSPAKIFMLTGLQDSEKRAESLRVGVSNYYTRPIRLAHIEEIIREWFAS